MYKPFLVVTTDRGSEQHVGSRGKCMHAVLVASGRQHHTST